MTVTKTIALSALAACTFASAAHADVVLGWNFENAATGQINNIAASTQASGVTSAAFSTANQGVANFGGSIGQLSLTRFFDSAANTPTMTFTLSEGFDNLSLSFATYHNHNPGFPTAPSYKYAVQINDGSGWANLGTDLIASAATVGATVSLNLATDLGPGSYAIRWIGYGFANNATNSNTEYFAIDNVTLATANLPEPASLALVGVALLGACAARRKRA